MRLGFMILRRHIIELSIITENNIRLAHRLSACYSRTQREMRYYTPIFTKSQTGV